MAGPRPARHHDPDRPRPAAGEAGHADRDHRYDDAKWFVPDAVRIDGLDDLLELLLGLAGRTDTCVIRGALKREFAHYPEVRRTLHDKTGSPGKFDEPARSWLMADVEPKATPAWVDPTDPVETGGHLRRQLPDPFRPARAIAQLSGGAGIKQGLRCHLWFMLDRPLIGTDLKRLLDGVDGLDPATLRPVQIHYTASPVFDGIDDPCTDRFAVLPGFAEVVVPALPDPAQRQALSPGRVFSPVGVGVGFAGVGSAERIAQARLRRLAAMPAGHRHNAIIRTAVYLLGIAKTGQLDPIRVGSMIKGVASPWGDLSEVDRILAWAWSAVQQKEPGK
jgi:hypothetical protein